MTEKYRKFNKDVLEKIVKMSIKTGRSEKSISEEMGYSPNNINLYKHKFGVASKSKNYRYTKTKKEIEEIIRYAKENKIRQTTVAKKYGISESMLRKYKDIYGIEKRKVVPMSKTKEEINEILQYALDFDIPEKEAAKIFGITPFVLWAYKAKYKIEMSDPHSSKFKSHPCKSKIPVIMPDLLQLMAVCQTIMKV